MQSRPYVGETATDGQTHLPFTLRAEATSWNIADTLVQIRAFQGGGYEVRESNKYGEMVISYYIGPDEEEAYRMFLHRAFGA
jgi:hypothetical protein